MIASLHGEVVDISLNSAVIECGGVGYLFMATPRTLAGLRRGENARVLTTMIVREDAMTLYGFEDTENRELFTILQTVSGLGPRLALAAQAVYTPTELATAISAGDAKALQRIPGVGKRMAERMVVDLKGKVGAWVGQPDVPAEVQVVASAAHEPVIEALSGLGFSEKVAEKAVAGVLADTPELSTPALLRAALATLGRG